VGRFGWTFFSAISGSFGSGPRLGLFNAAIMPMQQEEAR
jgi:hypothetical protein